MSFGREKFSNLVLVIMALLMSGCSGYRALAPEEPHGYQSEQSESGNLQVSFTTWRGWSDKKLCDYASRRAHELAQGAALVGPEIKDVSEEFTHLDSINAMMRQPIESGLQGDVSVMLTPDYVMFKRVRSCSWSVLAVGG